MQIACKSKSFAFYETLDFEEYYVRPMDRVQIRENENDTGVTVGEGSNISFRAICTAKKCYQA